MKRPPTFYEIMAKALEQSTTIVARGYTYEEIEEIRAEVRRETWADAIAFVENGRFLHDDAPPLRFAKECAKAMRDRGPPPRAKKEPT